MKIKIMAIALVAFLAFGGSAFAAHGDMDGCDSMTKKECRKMCKEMTKRPSDYCEGMDCGELEQAKVNMKDCMKMMKKPSSSEGCC
ncbi:hypothetical protein [Desmospora profundinema]|uniref:Cys-rich protein n=1 Tax=Desmospora profundinema TaxID=1571184 RepID=A0ABU1IPY8_9BACL|nr:hypothetical protein [Desmospora profundinema]MDR6226850.1 hypothetical protein [Desmospora profundinema]